MLVYAPGWSLASQLWSYTPPKKVSFPAAKKMKIPHWKLFSWSNFFWKFWRFTVFAAKNLSRRSRLSRWSRAPSRLIRPRPIYCDGGRDRQTLISRFFEEEKHFFFRARHLVVIYTPKEAHSRIFVTGGSVIAWQMLVKKTLFLGRPACT